MSPEIAVLSTGGTIASTEAETGPTPSKRGEELVEEVPELSNYADLTVKEVANQPSFDMDFERMSEIATVARTTSANGVDGIVVTHGTDTMEESAYFLDLVLDIDTSVVFTGAQRRPDEVSSDAPANLITAARAACNTQFVDNGGVYIAANEEIHAARNVTKRHTSKLETFESPETGPVASVMRDSFRIFRKPGSYSRSFEVDTTSADVAIVNSAAGIGRRAIDHAVESNVEGIIINGTGLGNTTSEIGDAVADAIEQNVPVAIASRCYAGSTAPVYGTRGGGKTLQSHGAIHAQDLPAHKARIKLALACETTTDIEHINSWFEPQKSFYR